MLNLQTSDRDRQVDTSQASLHAYLAPLVAKSHYRKIAITPLKNEKYIIYTIIKYPLAELNQRMLNPSYRFAIY